MSELVARRVAATIAVLAFFAMATVLLLADRSGSILGIARDIVVDLGRRVEAAYEINFLDRDDVPGTVDQIAHALLWGTGMLIVGWSLRRRVPIVLTALFVAGLSLAFEVAQPLVSTTRAFEPTDATANITGVALATGVLIVVVGATRRLARG